MINSFLFQIIFAGVLGAVAGYYTNVIALKKLFSKNGIIAREKNNFIDAVSIMISEKIINYHTVLKEIKKYVFENALISFFQNTLKSIISNTSIKIKNINGFINTKNNFRKYIKDNTSNNLDNILSYVLRNIKLEDLIDKENFNYSINKLYSEIINYEKDYKLISNIINKSYSSNKKEYDKIIKEFLNKFLFNKDINKLIINISEEIELKKIFYNLCNNIIENDLYSIIKIENKIEVKNIIKNIAENKNLHYIINNLLNIAIDKLKNTNKTIYEILDDNISIKLQEILKNNFPKLIDTIITLIEENKNKIDSLIENAIDEEIENIDNILIKGIAYAIRNSFLQNISSKYDIIKKIISYIDEYKNNENSSIIITNNIIQYLKENNIADIINKFDSVNIEKAKNSIYNIIIFNLNDIPDNCINNILSIKLKNIINEEIIDNIYNFLYKEAINIIYKNNTLKIKILNKIDNLESIHINNLYSILENSKEYIINIINKIYDNNKSKYLYDIYNDIDNILNSIFKLLDNLIEKVSENYLNQLIIKEENNINKFINNQSYKSIINFIEKEKSIISKILESIVVNTIKKNMYKLSNEKIANMANDFMGKELEPINIVGAFLGAIFGIISVYIIPLNYVNTNFGIFNYIIEPILYASIGVITNVLAIYSIFKPYKPLFGIKKKVFWGAVASEKERFANSMADFVNDKLMERDGILEIISNKEEIENNIIKDNYKIFLKYIANYDEIDINKIIVYIKNNINNILSNENIINYIININYLENTKNIISKDEIIKYRKEIIESILEYLFLYIKENSDNIYKLFIDYVDNNISKVRHYILYFILKFTNSKDFRFTIYRLLDNAIIKSNNKKVKELFNGELIYIFKHNSEYIVSSLQNKLLEILNNDIENIVNSIIREFPSANMAKNLVHNIVYNIINKKLPKFIIEIKNNLTSIISNFINENILEKNVSEFTNGNSIYKKDIMINYIEDIFYGNKKYISESMILLFNSVDNKIIKKYINNFLEYVSIYVKNSIIEITNIKSYNSILEHLEKLNIINFILENIDSIINNIFISNYKEDIDNFLLSLQDKNIVDINKFKTSINNIINKLNNDEIFIKITNTELNNIFINFSSNIANIIDDETKNYLFDTVLSSCKENINLIIDAINFSNIAKEEINNMDPKNIEDLFNSFAKKYLNRLKIYGAFGGIVGIYLAIIKYPNNPLSNILFITLIIITIVYFINMIINIVKNTTIKKI